MNYWIIVATVQKTEEGVFSPEEVFSTRMQDRFWGLGEKTSNRRHLRKGDKVVFYLGNPIVTYAGTATLASDSFQLTSQQAQQYSHGKQRYSSEYGILIEDIDLWQNPKPARDLVDDLNFIENKQYWGAYFQGGVRQVSEVDYLTIIGERKSTLVEQIATSRDLESQSEFALESHLEEFIYQNWNNIDWGAHLVLYQVDNQDGRQFPAGIWSIDFLAVDQQTNDLVVIELKRGKTSDATVGQTLRYISWVKENVADTGQDVRGIIIAKEIDEALRYAVKGQSIQVKRYRVDFHMISHDE
jgi:hypothetical protein